MSQRPALKLKAPKPEASTTPQPQSATTSTPKLKLKFPKLPAPQTNTSNSTSTAPTGSKTAAKTPRKTKPTPKKRALESIDDENEDVEEVRSAPGPAIKKIKLNTRAPVAPLINLFHKKKNIPKRPKGVGYDSEASDRELDPTLSEGFILRMQPGEDCDIIRKAAAEGNFGRKAGGADVRMRFLTADGRRAAVSVNGRHYAAVLVDLPCVIEAMKSWEKKGPWIKSLDVCQMLIVMGPIKEEDDAMHYPIPNGKGQLNGRGELDEKTMQWASGLTPPLHKVRTRRFRKRISIRDVMEVEAEVERLLRDDDLAVGEPIVEFVDENEMRSRQDRGGESGSEDASDNDEDGMEGEEEDADAEGSPYPPSQPNNQPNTDPVDVADVADADHAAMAQELEAAMELEAALAADPALSDADPDPSPSDNNTPTTHLSTPTSAKIPTPSSTPSSSEEEEEEEEDDSVDEDAIERQQERQRQREEIADLESAIAQERAKAEAIGNALLRKKLGDKIRSLQGDLELKVKALGE